MMNTTETIAAISTPLGEGGIGIVRLSGSDAVKVAARVFKPARDEDVSSYATHTAHYGHVVDPGTGEIIDEVLVTVMRGPATYTTEDIVEINCHGGMAPLKAVLELCLKEGARLAEPGEFTKRAFLNGKLDLAQSEAVLDVISARSDAARRAAIDQLKGSVSKEVGALRKSTLDILSRIELSIDFSDEDVDFTSLKELTSNILHLRTSIKNILATSGKGIILKEGVHVVICGKPNVGKSSLMNALLRHERVIVTSVSGTTRDVVQESMNIGGVDIRLSDTAGIVSSNDLVEIEGIKRSREIIDRADIVIFMIDFSRPLTKEDREIFDFIREKKKIVVANKSDLSHVFSLDDARDLFGPVDIIEVSALRHKGLGKIEDAVSGKIFDGAGSGFPEGAVITNIRHREALEAALRAADRALEITGGKYNSELLANDLNDMVYNLGLITGETVTDDILDRIFSQFCIGK